MLVNRLAAACLVAAACLLVLMGCDGSSSESTAPPTDTTSLAVAPADSGPGFTTRDMTVTLQEGTNLALAVDPVTGDRVLSLQGVLFLLPADGSDAVTLTDNYYDAREPQFSTDGKSLVFQGYLNGNWDIWQVGRDGQPPVALTNDGFDDREPQYSVDGSKVVFSSDRSGRYDIWQIDTETAGLKQLTQTSHNAYAPSLSPDGVLAYVEEGSGVARLMQLTLAGEETLLVEEQGIMAGVQWSPDGQAVAYQVFNANGSQLKILSVDSKTAVTLSRQGADVFPFKPAWLNNDELAYTADGKVYKRRLSGDEREEWPFAVDVTLTRHQYARKQRDYDADAPRTALGLSSPVISNDGQHIYFSALGDLWHWQPESGDLAKLTDDPFAEYAPTLSPDGQQLAYVSDADGKVGLRLMNLVDRGVRVLPLPAQQVTAPSFSPDGKKLAFFASVPGNPLGGQLMVMTLDSGKLLPVLDPMPAQPISWDASGQHVAVARLNPYSSRYREGLYELVVVDVASEKEHSIIPKPHRSLLNGALTPDGAMTYVQGGVLHRLELDDKLMPLEQAGQVTNELTDMPQWSANGKHLVYLSGNRLKHWRADSGQTRDVTPQIKYTLATPTERYVIHAGRLFTGTSDTYLEDQMIWVNGAVIDKITPPLDTGDLPVVDATQQVVVPGLFEMHAHMGETSESQGRVWLSYGITTVRDPGSNPYVAKERQEAWDSGRRKGPRTHITGYLTDGNRVFYSMAEGIVSEAHLEKALHRTKQLQLDFIKTYVRLPDHWQKQVVDFAHGLGIPVSSHELYPAVAHGMDHVEHIGGTSRRGYQPKVSRLGYSYGDVVELLSASGMGITPTAVLPGFSVILKEQPDWFDSTQFEHFYGDQARAAYLAMMARFGGGAEQIAQANGALLKTLTQRDALVVTGTDSPFVPYGAGLHAELRLYARAGIKPADVIRQATLKSAMAAGVAAELGTLEAGKLADMVILDGDPLVDIGDLDNVVMTVKHGRRYDLSELLTVE